MYADCWDAGEKVCTTNFADFTKNIRNDLVKKIVPTKRCKCFVGVTVFVVISLSVYLAQNFFLFLINVIRGKNDSILFEYKNYRISSRDFKSECVQTSMGFIIRFFFFFLGTFLSKR